MNLEPFCEPLEWYWSHVIHLYYAVAAYEHGKSADLDEQSLK